MRTKWVASGLLSVTVVATAAMAQAPSPPTGSADSGSANTQFITQATTGVLRVSDLLGQSVFGPDGKDIGEIEDVVLDRNGRIAAFVIEVEGGLGAGDREVAVPAHAVQVDPADTTASTGTIRSEGLPASTAEGQQARRDMTISNVLTPERVILTIPADQLKSAPEFDDD